MKNAATRAGVLAALVSAPPPDSSWQQAIDCTYPGFRARWAALSERCQPSHGVLSGRCKSLRDAPSQQESPPSPATKQEG